MVTQAQSKDFGIWSSFQFNLEASDQLDFVLKDQFRLDENSTHFQQNLTEIRANYKFSKSIRFNAGYRFGFLEKENVHRPFIETVYRIKLSSFRTNWYFQNNIERNFFTEGQNNWMIRPKTMIKFDAKGAKVKPFFSYEMWLKLSKNQNGLDQHRTNIGFQYELSKKTAMQLSYMHFKFAQTSPKLANHLILINLIVDLPKFFEKKKPKEG